MRVIFRLCRIFPVKTAKIVALRNFPAAGSLGVLGDYLEGRGKWRVLRLTPRSPLLLFHLATARAVFLDNNFTPLKHLDMRKSTKVVQIWHGDGALKRFGGEKNPYPYDAVVCSAEHVRPFWAEAFQLPAERLLPLGSARMNALARPFDAAALRIEFDRKHPQCKGKRLVLYAPTFRDDRERNRTLLSHFDFEEFARRFPDTVLLVRMHPRMHGAYKLPAGVPDMTSEPDAAPLLRVCDRFITDYSSLCLDAAVLDVPVLLYLFDEEEYMTEERGFYVPFRTLAPGPIANTFEELLDLLAAPDTSKAQRRAFVDYHLGELDGKACERIELLIDN